MSRKSREVLIQPVLLAAVVAETQIPVAVCLRQNGAHGSLEPIPAGIAERHEEADRRTMVPRLGLGPEPFVWRDLLLLKLGPGCVFGVLDQQPVVFAGELVPALEARPSITE